MARERERKKDEEEEARAKRVARHEKKTKIYD